MKKSNLGFIKNTDTYREIFQVRGANLSKQDKQGKLNQMKILKNRTISEVLRLPWQVPTKTYTRRNFCESHFVIRKNGINA